MKCEKCGANLTLEDEICPSCGSVNSAGAMYGKKMKEYEGDYARTKAWVFKKTRLNSQVTGKAIVITVLFLILCGLMVLSSCEYEIKNSIMEKEHRKNYEANALMIDSYVENGRLLELACWSENTRATSCWEIYDEQYDLLRACQQYSRIYNYILSIVAPDKYSSDDSIINSIEDICSDFEYFLKEYRGDEYTQRTQKQQQQLDIVYQELQYLLNTYFNMSNQQFEEFVELTSARKQVMLEDLIMIKGE